MVTASLGDEYTEQQLARILGSYEFGTPASHVTRLSRLGYRIQFGRSSLPELQSHLEQHRFPITFVRADFLPWTDFGGFHALVLIEITATEITLLDPALDVGPVQLSKSGFLLAWEEFDCLAAIIYRRR